MLRRLSGPGVLLRWQRRLRLFLRAGRRLLLRGVLHRRVPRRQRLPAEGAPLPARLVRQVQRKRPHGHRRLGYTVSQDWRGRRLSPRPRAGSGRRPLVPRCLFAFPFGRGQLPGLPTRRGQQRLLSSRRGRLIPRVSGGHRGASRHRPLAPAAAAGGSPGPGSPAARLSARAPTGSGLRQGARDPGRRRHRRPRRPRPCSARRAAPPRVERSANRPPAPPASATHAASQPTRAGRRSREPSPGAGNDGGAARRTGGPLAESDRRAPLEPVIARGGVEGRSAGAGLAAGAGPPGGA